MFQVTSRASREPPLAILPLLPPFFPRAKLLFSLPPIFIENIWFA